MINKKKNILRTTSYFASLFIWIGIWHIAAEIIDNQVFLPAPVLVAKVLFKELLPSTEFWHSLMSSVLHIGCGFIIGLVCGIILAVISFVFAVAEGFIWLPMKIIKSVPVASFVILSLLWFDAEQLSIVISAMVVLPIIYTNTFTGIKQTDVKLLEMAQLFKVEKRKRISCIYIPNALPYVLAAISLSVSMAWKAGIAAEIIGLAKNSIGNELYKAKLYLMIPELFAWTIVIVILSIISEFIINMLISRLNN